MDTVAFAIPLNYSVARVHRSVHGIRFTELESALPFGVSHLTHARSQSNIAAVLTRLARLFIVLALSLSLGTQWIVIQTVAWVGMVMNYSQETSFRVALLKTFDGQHPCRLCQMVKAGKASEPKRPCSVPSSPKFELVCLTGLVWIAPHLPSEKIASLPFSFSRRAEPPPLPPPRSV